MHGRSVGRPVKSAATQFAWTAMCIGSAFPNWCLREVSQLDYFRDQLSPIHIRCSLQRFGSGTNIGGGDCVVPLNPFSLVGVVI